MDVIFSPLITVILNVIANGLIADGILNSSNRVAFIQGGNQLLAGLMTVAVAIVSVYKMVDLQKHKLNSTQNQQKQQISQQISQTPTPGQSELPTEQVTTPVTPAQPVQA